VQFFFQWTNSPNWARASSLSRLQWSHSVRHTTFGRTPLDELSTRSRDLYLSTHNTHKRQSSMPLTWFEPAILERARPQTHTWPLASAPDSVQY
jgi:hypothetical protein